LAYHTIIDHPVAMWTLKPVARPVCLSVAQDSVVNGLKMSRLSHHVLGWPTSVVSCSKAHCCISHLYVPSRCCPRWVAIMIGPVRSLCC